MSNLPDQRLLSSPGGSQTPCHCEAGIGSRTHNLMGDSLINIATSFSLMTAKLLKDDTGGGSGKTVQNWIAGVAEEREVCILLTFSLKN